MTMAERFEHRCIISGIGQSEVGRRMTRGVLALTLDACLEAIGDAGLTPADIDGVISWPGAVTRAEGLAPRGPGSSGPGAARRHRCAAPQHELARRRAGDARACSPR